MAVVDHLFIILVSCAAWWKGASWLVDAAARIAKRMGISELVIGLTVVAFGTSAPEFAVTIGATLRGEMDISVANIIGSNIFNIGFILGGCAIVTTIRINRSIVWRDGLLLFVITAVLVGMLWDRTLSRLEGTILLTTLVVYLVFLFWKKSAPLEEEISQTAATWKDGPLLIMGLALILAGQHWMVESAVELAQMIISLTDSRSQIVYKPLPVDDPKVRQPNITRAQELLGWEPRISLMEGLQRTLAYFRTALS